MLDDHNDVDSYDYAEEGGQQGKQDENQLRECRNEDKTRENEIPSSIQLPTVKYAKFHQRSRSVDTGRLEYEAMSPNVDDIVNKFGSLTRSIRNMSMNVRLGDERKKKPERWRRSFKLVKRRKGEQIGMDHFTRLRKNIRSKLLRFINGCTISDPTVAETSFSEHSSQKQYIAMRGVNQSYKDGGLFDLTHNAIIVPFTLFFDLMYGQRFITWSMMESTSYLTYLSLIILHFFGHMVFFMILVMICTKLEPKCIRCVILFLRQLFICYLFIIMFLTMFSTNQYKPMDAFVLSWTTYTTVGYGHISPSIDPADHVCIVKRLLFTDTSKITYFLFIIYILVYSN